MTRRHLALVAAGIVCVGLWSGCSSSGSDSSKGSTTTTSTGKTTTTSDSKGPSDWVKQWDIKLVTDYGPAQEAFLSAVQTAKTADVQAAIGKVQAANEVLTAAIRAAGPPPASDAAAAAQLLEGLAAEASLVPFIEGTCIGTDPKCQTLVTQYADNNKDVIVTALTALRAGT